MLIIVLLSFFLRFAVALYSGIEAMRRHANPWMFGPLFATASASVFFDLHLGLPNGASQFGQLMIGSSLGCYSWA
ncbi:AbrB family transcriptional regulator [Pseudomonas fluorescens]|uniref:AbrB family transcriptional regulator n=1 Tax=Pseudomonas fluorescens TaxID=294 RepID=UPI00398FFEF7